MHEFICNSFLYITDPVKTQLRLKRTFLQHDIKRNKCSRSSQSSDSQTSEVIWVQFIFTRRFTNHWHIQRRVTGSTFGSGTEPWGKHLKTRGIHIVLWEHVTVMEVLKPDKQDKYQGVKPPRSQMIHWAAAASGPGELQPGNPSGCLFCSADVSDRTRQAFRKQ